MRAPDHYQMTGDIATRVMRCSADQCDADPRCFSSFTLLFERRARGSFSYSRCILAPYPYPGIDQGIDEVQDKDRDRQEIGIDDGVAHNHWRIVEASALKEELPQPWPVKDSLQDDGSLPEGDQKQGQGDASPIVSLAFYHGAEPPLG